MGGAVVTHLGIFTGVNNLPQAPDPCPTLPQAILAALCLALFVCGGLALLYGATC